MTLRRLASTFCSTGGFLLIFYFSSFRVHLPMHLYSMQDIGLVRQFCFILHTRMGRAGLQEGKEGFALSQLARS